MGRRRTAALVTAVVALTVVPSGLAGARTNLKGFTAFDRRMLADINAARVQRGLPALQLNSRLEPVAHRWAERIAAKQHVYDNPHLRRTMNAACPGWRHIGEVAGRAGEAGVDQLFRRYMRDPTRRDTILSRHLHVVGVSTVATDDDGSTVHWNAIDFANACGG